MGCQTGCTSCRALLDCVTLGFRALSIRQLHCITIGLYTLSISLTGGLTGNCFLIKKLNKANTSAKHLSHCVSHKQTATRSHSRGYSKGHANRFGQRAGQCVWKWQQCELTASFSITKGRNTFPAMNEWNTARAHTGHSPGPATAPLIPYNIWMKQSVVVNRWPGQPVLSSHCESRVTVISLLSDFYIIIESSHLFVFMLFLNILLSFSI